MTAVPLHCCLALMIGSFCLGALIALLYVLEDER